MERVLREKLVDGSFGEVSPVHSRRMGAIRSGGNKTTESRFRALLVRSGIRGWTIKTNRILGKPDFLFLKRKVAIFLDGCFWHGCPQCGHVPSTNRPFWKTKIARNRKRDRRINAALADHGYRVLRLWEHELKNTTCLGALRDLLIRRDS